jgi:putative ABC transport system substrate-binding protein
MDQGRAVADARALSRAFGIASAIGTRHDADNEAIEMKRREFITLLGGTAAAWPLTARAQLAGKTPTIGFLGSQSQSSQKPWTDAFVQRLRGLGWIDGRTVAIEYRWADGIGSRAAEFIAEFVRLKVDVIVTNGTPMVLAAKRATSTIPIVFAATGDPVGAGLVTNLRHPGGNVTGLSLQASDLAGKDIELLREVRPGFSRLAIIVNISSANTVSQLREAQAAARTLGIAVDVLEIRHAEDIGPAFEAAKARAQALFVLNDPLVISQRARINELAIAAGLPTVYALREFADSGGLISYGPHFPDLFRRAAEFVDKILRGAKAGDIPVEQPTKFELVINLKTARALGITVPPTLLARADEVIE